jgi:hypothetical protein
MSNFEKNKSGEKKRTDVFSPGRTNEDRNQSDGARKSLSQPPSLFRIWMETISKRFDECALFRITLNAHTLTHSHTHNGTQTILETVHVQDDRVRASRLCRVWRSNVLHRRRRLEVRELARVVRERRDVVFEKIFSRLSFVFPISFLSLSLFTRWDQRRERERKMKTKRARATLPPIVREPTRAG